ncbi:hypothetical protein AK812_SmicGene35000 [Symbiodinium microadriaticum]|uniref:Uncharacterized protein n=1 Tax=Symbiodinium microadriaticum TaxID=2951 RepID=A0A1Q9CMM1_SYMMI|nr:hypothetical protein AK812_SmicGene35000 [Symbiodinium microadriaticum]
MARYFYNKVSKKSSWQRLILSADRHFQDGREYLLPKPVPKKYPLPKKIEWPAELGPDPSAPAKPQSVGVWQVVSPEATRGEMRKASTHDLRYLTSNLSDALWKELIS